MANTADYERMERRDYCGAAPRFLQPGWHPAWIAILVLSFIFFWPLGLVLLFHARKPRMARVYALARRPLPPGEDLLRTRR